MSNPIPTRFRVRSFSGKNLTGELLSTVEIELTTEEASVEYCHRREFSSLKVARHIDKTRIGLADGAASFGLTVLS